MTDDDNPVKDFPIKMKFSRVVLPKDSRIWEPLNKGTVMEFRRLMDIIPGNFFCNKWSLLIELVFWAQTSEV